MNFLDVILLSIVEGISEFLPISSTGHLVLSTKLLNIQQTDFVKSFEISIQLGAILSIIILYRNSLLIDKNVWIRVITAFLPTAILGLVFYKIIKHFLLGNLTVTLLALLIGGVILIIIELFYKEKEHYLNDINNLSMKKAFIVGLFQSISMIPGVSRSASTIIGGLLLGMKRKPATEFSFLLAIPTMMAASGLDLLQTSFNFSSQEFLLLATGFFGAFCTALISVKFFISYIQKNNFIAFGIYRIILAIAFWIFVV